MIVKKKIPNGLDLQGHRGCRGLMPENTLPGFLKALEFNITTLEMDVVITRDKKVLVSHDPFMSHEFCIQPDGKQIGKKEEQKFAIYHMDYEEIVQWDCGSKLHSRFPQQLKLKAHKPLLEEVLRSTQQYSKRQFNKEIFYNIEIKSTIEYDGIFHPPVSEFTDLVVEVLEKNKMSFYTTIQSFDVRALQHIRQNHKPDVAISYLVENDSDHQGLIQKLGFMPNVYSPEYLLVEQSLIDFAKNNDIRVIPWTINDLITMKKLIGLGVDGLISDFPNLYSYL